MSVWLTGWWNHSSISCGLQSGFSDRELGLGSASSAGECLYTSLSDRACWEEGALTGITTAEKEFEKQISENQNKGGSVCISVQNNELCS